ncbi:MAG TPA: helix-turn-helix domain-containing protein [Sphingopyxis sp.]|nr:helix-turn-helix domain-containing protein [Sphingopyxis sp.]
MTSNDIASNQHAAREARGSERVELMIETDGLIGPGVAARVMLHNLSATGVLVETEAALDIAQLIHLNLPEAGQVAASIIWTSDNLYGCKFAQPLSRAALSAAKLRNSLIAEPDVRDGANGADGAPEAMSLPQRLRHLREQKGLSLAALSRRSGISKPSIWAWETGKTMPRPRSIQALAGALGMTAAEVWGLAPSEMGCEAEQGFSSAGAAISSGKDLHDAVAAARIALAEAAGVSQAQIKITIEF